MRVTTIQQLAVMLRLPPSSLSALRDLSLDDVEKLNELVDEAQSRHRKQMYKAMDDALGPLPIGQIYRFATKGRR